MRAASLLASVVLLALPAAGAGSADPPAPERVLARGTEFDLTLSKAKVKPGRVIVQFLNDGEDPHDLRIQREGGPEAGLGELLPGEHANLDTRLKQRSTYVLWCSLSDHRARGMEATLRTKRKHRH